jgi:NDP-sugar pyrophosphorylase family protein
VTDRTPALRAGVIAAGQGMRLRDGAPSGTRTLKPLVPVAGITLVERVLTSLAEAAPAEVAIIVNEESTAVQEHVSSRSWPFALRWIVETTPSSMHSFLRVVETLAAGDHPGPFLISTVDTVAAPGMFARFNEACRFLETDVTLAVTTPKDDENPLLVRVAQGSSRVTAIGPGAAGAAWATAGVYSVRASILREAEQARHDGVSALREFLGRLHDRDYRLAAIPVAGGIDVDRPGDIRAAERFLKQVGA